jgi:type I restriction enzyme S subunit
MSNENKKTSLPKLRFPEFQQAEAWEESNLGRFCASISSGKDKIIIDGTYDLYGSTGIIGKTDTYSQSGEFILVARVGANAGFLNRARGEFGVTDNTLIISLYDSENIDFVYFSLEKYGLNKLIFGSGQPLITGGQLKNLIIHWPKPEEQRRIADTLSSLNDVITTQSAKLAALKAHKRSLMQGLFPAEGETVPKLRFPEFQDEDEWEETTIGRICKAFSGGTPSTSQKKYYGGDIPFIRSAEIDKESTELFINEEGLANSAAKLVEKGDILFALYGANSGDVAISKQEGAINQAILCLRSTANNVFVFHFLTYRQDWIIKKYLQGGQGNLSGEIVKSIDILLPAPAEQNKIANCLSSLDNRITTQSQKIEALKLHKKGLMQTLFPNIEE